MDSSLVGRVSAGEDLSVEEMESVIDAVMHGRWKNAQIALLLTGLHAKGETANEVAGAALAMRRHMTRIPTSRLGLLDTCGTGGDGSGTFNISTAAAIVTAATGAPVAKHGNRKITSKTGSADVLAELGVNIDASVKTVSRCLDLLGICFCFAPQLHPAMKQVAEVRRSLGGPSIFNLLGPLSNPAEADFQLLGVGKRAAQPVIAGAIQHLPVERAVVVCGRDGLDEVTLRDTTDVTVIEGGQLRQTTWAPEDFGIERAGLSTMLVETPLESATMIRSILAGQTGPPRDIVVLNVAAALWTAGKSQSLPECAAMATAAIDSGAADKLLRDLAELSHTAS